MELKQSKTCEQQMEILKKRGCIIDDEEKCLQALSDIKYYRLTAYFLPFRDENNMFIPGTSFYKVYSIYEFDREIRAILFSAVEEIEIYTRARLSNYLAEKYGPECYLDRSIYNSTHNHEKLEKIISSEIKKNENIPFVKHHIENYDSKFPIWVITELYTFGMLSNMYSDLKTADQKFIATNFYNLNYKELKSYFRCCTDIRNICAHYGRLYFRIFSATPKNFGSFMSEMQAKRLWGAVNVIKLLHPYDNKWNNIVKDIKDTFDSYEDCISLDHIGFPENWFEQLLK